MPSFLRPLLLLSALFGHKNFVVSETSEFISNENDFYSFISTVNGGASYSGTTVFLDADLTLSQSTDPISTAGSFQGTFDGQGHTISNLYLNSSPQYAGLFGFSTGLTIKNIVLDSTCLVKSDYSGGSMPFTGGIISFCTTIKSDCKIENSVNMADVIFNGKVNTFSTVGGIMGYASAQSYTIYIKNCANYGSVMHSGTSSTSYLGGIVGCFEYQIYRFVQNSLNCGSIIHNGTLTGKLYMGGIVGYDRYTYIDNCMNLGVLSSSNAPSESYYGNIAGYAEDSIAHINYCYWSGNTGCDNAYGTGSPLSTTGTPSSSIGITEAVNELNNRASDNSDWSKWLLNLNKETISFKVNDNKELPISSQVILFPSLAGSDDLKFSGWYSDTGYKKLFRSSEVTEDTNLYGIYNTLVVVTLNATGGDVAPASINVTYNGTYGDLPTPQMTGYTFVGWFNDKNKSVTNETTLNILDNHTLYAHWAVSRYVVTFNFSNGETVDQHTLDFGKVITYPDNPTKEGYTFSGWSPNPDTVPANNITITAQWDLNIYTVTLNATGGDVTPSSISVAYNRTYGDLPTPQMAGYTFVGWFNDKNESITNETTLSILDNHTLYAQWIKVTNLVEVVFGTDDMDRKKVEEFISLYTKEFTIIEFENDNSGETKVIIKFTDPQAAEYFYRTINELSTRDRNVVKRIYFMEEGSESFSTKVVSIFTYFLY